MEKIMNLEERTFQFAKSVCTHCKKTEKKLENVDYIKQVIRSSAFIGANYIEVNESLSRKDALMRARISRKEAKETIYWLRLLHETHNSDTLQLINEAEQINKILSSIIIKLNT
jgi:four helix bundle protein